MPRPTTLIRGLFTGGYRALEGEFVSKVRELRREDALNPLIVVVTSRLLGLHLKRHLAQAGVSHLNIRFFTIEDLASHIAEPVIFREGKTRMPGFASRIVMAETLRSVASGTRDFYFSGIIDRSGFHDAMLATIRDLEEAAITPPDLRMAAKQPGVRHAVHTKKLRDLTSVWEAYRRLLGDLAWVDDYQVMLAATENLASSPLIRSTSSFLIYGFYDLNALQRRILRKCIEAGDTFAFMPFEDSRAFNFARPTLRWMESKGFSIRPAAPAGDDGASPVLQHLRAHLFAGASEAPRPQNAITFVSAPGEVREVREIARLIAGEAARLELGPHEIGILLRDPGTYGNILREMFEHIGLEPYVPEGKQLSETMEGRSVLLLLEVLARNYARSDVMEFITFASLRAEDGGGGAESPPSVHRWDAASVAAGIVEGVPEWEDRLTRLAEEYRSTKEMETHGGNGTPAGSFDYRDIGSLRRFMRRLAALLGAIGKAGTWSGKATALTRALKELTLEGRHTKDVIEAIERLGELDTLSSSPDQAGFMAAVSDCLDSKSLRSGRFERQGPAVVSLTGARGIPFKMVIVPGMTEKSFPPVIRQDAILLDHERQAINEAVATGGPLHLISRRRLDEERLLFRLAVGAATRRLVLTFPRLTIGTSRERLPSSFVLAAAEALTGRRAYFDTIEKTQGFHRVPLAEIAVSLPLEAVDQVEFDLATALENIRSNTPGGILCLRRYSPLFADGLRLEAARWGVRHFTKYDGVLSDAHALNLLKRNYDIVGGKVSPTRLEAYAACPFGYLSRYILEIEPLVEPEEARTISPMDKGYLVHTILWKFLTELKHRKGEPVSVASEDGALLRRIAGQVFKRFEETGVTGYPVMWDLEKEMMFAWLDGFIEEETGQGEFHPAYFEVRYGMKSGASEESEISTDEPVPLKFGRRRILLRGRVDRIDVSRDGRRARVVDYKTGKPHAKEEDFQGGTTLQLPLYIHAARHVLKNLHPEIEDVSAEYYHLGARGKKRHIGFSGDCLEEKREELSRILNTIADGIAGGLFFPLPGDLCRWCSLELACGASRQRMLARKLTDPRAEAFLTMRGEITTEPGEGGSSDE